MATKKQYLYPIIALAVLVAGVAALIAMKKPPEEKKKEVTLPIVQIEAVTTSTHQLDVSSYGVVSPKYDTRLVAQVSGQIVQLSSEFVKGDFVKEGTVLARIDPNDYEAALVEAEASLASAKASLELEKAAGHVAQEEWSKITSQEASALGLRKPQLKQELARVKAAEAAVKRAKRNLERTYIKAPFDALISSREVGLGGFVTTGTRLGNLLSTSVAEVRLPVADGEMQYLRDGGINAAVSLIATVAGKESRWKAKIVRSEGVVDDQSRMTYLIAEVTDPYGLSSEKPALRFGTYINAKIEGFNFDNVVSLPRHLVNDGQVATLGADNKLKFKPVSILREDGTTAIISEGLVSGDKVITSALDFPFDGMALSTSDSKAPQNDDDAAVDVALNKE